MIYRNVTASGSFWAIPYSCWLRSSHLVHSLPCILSRLRECQAQLFCGYFCIHSNTETWMYREYIVSGHLDVFLIPNGYSGHNGEIELNWESQDFSSGMDLETNPKNTTLTGSRNERHEERDKRPLWVSEKEIKRLKKKKHRPRGPISALSSLSEYLITASTSTGEKKITLSEQHDFFSRGIVFLLCTLYTLSSYFAEGPLWRLPRTSNCCALSVSLYSRLSCSPSSSAINQRERKSESEKMILDL